MKMTFPDYILNGFLDDVTDATDLARAGDVDGGWRVLWEGIDRARKMRYEGHPFKDPLIWQYDVALEDYHAIYMGGRR